MKFLVVHSLNESRYGSYQFNGVHSICYYSLAASKIEKILMLKPLTISFTNAHRNCHKNYGDDDY